MTDTNALAEQLQQKFGDSLQSVTVDTGEVTVEVAPDKLVEVATALRDELGFEMLIDLCGVDYLGYGQSEWDAEDASHEGFSRGIEALGPGRFAWDDRPEAGDVEHRFAVVVHLLSFKHNRRLRLRCFAPADGMPILPSLTSRRRARCGAGHRITSVERVGRARHGDALIIHHRNATEIDIAGVRDLIGPGDRVTDRDQRTRSHISITAVG